MWLAAQMKQAIRRCSLEELQFVSKEIDTVGTMDGCKQQGATVQQTAVRAGLAEHLGFLQHYVNNDSTVEIFECMSDASRTSCFKHMTMYTYHAGQPIVKEGDLGDAVYFVEEGEALATDGTRELRRFQPGGFFGEIAFMACARSAFGLHGCPVAAEEKLRVCDVVATTSCACWKLNVKHFVQAISDDLSSNHAAVKLLSKGNDRQVHAAMKMMSKVSDQRLEEARSKGADPARRKKYLGEVQVGKLHDVALLSSTHSPVSANDLAMGRNRPASSASSEFSASEGSLKVKKAADPKRHVACKSGTCAVLGRCICGHAEFGLPGPEARGPRALGPYAGNQRPRGHSP
jgi:CRP-like cAMP-binding protein